MRKILLIGSNSIHLWRYLEMIRGEFDEIFIITDELPSNHSTIDAHIFVFNFSLRNFTGFIKTLIKIKKLIAIHNPNIIHIHQAGTHALATIIANKKYRIPIVLTAWGSDVLLTPHRGCFYREMIKYNLNHVSVLTSDSFYMAMKIRELIDTKELSVEIANFGIRVKIDKIYEKEKIIYSNRNHEELYNIDVIIKKFKLFLESQNEHWRLVIAGMGSKTEYLKQLVKSLNIEKHVDFIGWVDSETNSIYYNKAKIYISLPKSDATSISLLEAIACGCIPIVSNLPANLEWVIDGINGIVVHDFNSLFFNRALSVDTFFLNPINEKLVQQRATIEVNREKFIDIYQKLIKNEERSNFNERILESDRRKI